MPRRGLRADHLARHRPARGCPAAQAVSAKNMAKVSVTAQIRTYAQAIANNPGVRGKRLQIEN